MLWVSLRLASRAIRQCSGQLNAWALEPDCLVVTVSPVLSQLSGLGQEWHFPVPPSASSSTTWNPRPSFMCLRIWQVSTQQALRTTSGARKC